MGMTHRLFVYGTLMRGEPNHGLLQDSELIGHYETAPTFHLVSLGAYPALLPHGLTAVAGEVYQVPSATVAALDAFEGHPTLYLRQDIALADGSTAEAYVLVDPPAVATPIAGGAWRRRSL